MRSTMAQKVFSIIGAFVINYALIFILLVLAVAVIGDLYQRYFKINRDTDHIDLIKEYNNLKLRKRYKL